MIYNVIFGGMELPRVLTEEEFDYYFKLFKEGNMDARDTLINHNIRLVVMIVQKYFGDTEYELEELLSIGIIGLIKAVDTFDIDKNKKISTYASRCIKNEILMYFRKKDLVTLSLDEPIGGYEDAPLIWEMFSEDDSNSLEEEYIDKEIKEIRKQTILDVLNTLSDKERLVIMMYFGFIDGKVYKQREIADVVNISRSRVCRIIESTLKKIKRKILLEQIYLEMDEYILLSKKLVK